jgi:hypothetical protein
MNFYVKNIFNFKIISLKILMKINKIIFFKSKLKIKKKKTIIHQKQKFLRPILIYNNNNIL